MNAAAVIDVVLLLLEGILIAANQNKAVDLVDTVQAAIAKLKTVKGTPVTKKQVDSLRVTKLW